MTTRSFAAGLCFLATTLAALPFAGPAAAAPDPELARLAQEVDRLESVRAVKTLQTSYSQYSQFGLWDEMASLFAEQGEVVFDKDAAKGHAAIRDYFLAKFGGGQNGLKPGGLHTQMLFEQVVNVAPDGKTAKGRWREMSMLGQLGVTASWTGGIMENDFIKEGGIWKIARLRHVTQFAGPYQGGWHNVVSDLPVTPYHFTADQAGTPILRGTVSEFADSTPALPALVQRINALNDEDSLRNLQNIYGYYVDRRMWDDVTDLFAADGVLEVGGAGTYQGVKSIRRALEASGPSGLRRGQLNDHIQINPVVTISGNEAFARGIDFGLLGDAADGQKAFWSVSVFSNRYAKGSDGKWRIREMRLFPVMKTDFYQGWAKSWITETSPKPDRALPAADRPNVGVVSVPAFRAPNPVTGKAVSVPVGMRLVGVSQISGQATGVTAPDQAVPFAEAKRRLAMSIGYDAVENLASAFGDWIADSQWDSLGALFAAKGLRQYPSAGSYEGPGRIAESEVVRNGALASPRTSIGPHIMAQPVIDVSADGRSAKYRVRLFQLGSSVDRPGSVSGGMYANDQAVLVDGVWKIWSIAIDEFYYQGDLVEGWSKNQPRPIGPSRLDTIFRPDIPRSVLGKRAEGIHGGPGTPIFWPDILPMWFHYKNPVSGRTPPNYWPDCVTCEYRPSTSVTANGY